MFPPSAGILQKAIDAYLLLCMRGYTTVRTLEATLVFPSPPLAGILRRSVRRMRAELGRKMADASPHADRSAWSEWLTCLGDYGGKGCKR